MVHSGGHTTIGDLATGLFDFDSEVVALSNHLKGMRCPSEPALWRTELYWVRGITEKGPELINKLPEFNSHRLEFGRHIKLFSDGAFSQLAQNASRLHRWTFR